MSDKKSRRGLSRLGKTAGEIFQTEPDPVPLPEPEPVSPSESSLLEVAPALAMGLWWQDLCYLRTRQICQYWWSGL